MLEAPVFRGISLAAVCGRQAMANPLAAPSQELLEGAQVTATVVTHGVVFAVTPGGGGGRGVGGVCALPAASEPAPALLLHSPSQPLHEILLLAGHPRRCHPGFPRDVTWAFPSPGLPAPGRAAGEIPGAPSSAWPRSLGLGAPPGRITRLLNGHAAAVPPQPPGGGTSCPDSGAGPAAGPGRHPVPLRFQMSLETSCPTRFGCTPSVPAPRGARLPPSPALLLLPGQPPGAGAQ